AAAPSSSTTPRRSGSSCAGCSPIPGWRRSAARPASSRSRPSTAPCARRSSSSRASWPRSRWPAPGTPDGERRARPLQEPQPQARRRCDERGEPVSDLSARVTRAWQRGVGPAGSRVLGVAAGGYRGLLGTRDWLYARGVLKCRGLGVPVVSVGNLTVGGTGMTPAVELAVRTLMELGHRPAVVSRGYGRRGHGIQVVADAASIRLDADEGGDEPFL